MRERQKRKLIYDRYKEKGRETKDERTKHERGLEGDVALTTIKTKKRCARTSLRRGRKGGSYKVKIDERETRGQTLSFRFNRCTL
jgi:hypothetical protein